MNNKTMVSVIDDGVVLTIETLNVVNRQFSSRASLSSETGLE